MVENPKPLKSDALYFDGKIVNSYWNQQSKNELLEKTHILHFRNGESHIHLHIMHQNLEHKGAEAAARAINNSKIGLLYNKSRVDWL